MNSFLFMKCTKLQRIIILTITNIIITLTSNIYVQDVEANYKSEFTYKSAKNSPIGSDIFGQIVGIDIDRNNNVIIFHRGSQVWQADTFNQDEIYTYDRTKPIKEPTVVFIDFKQNKWIDSWGTDLFYMPHGLTISHDGDHIWLTDVALHQVFKYKLDGSKRSLVLGTRFVPGNDENHFCKPTSVADTGKFIFVADGYCNSRIVMFTTAGLYVGQFGQPNSNSFSPISKEPQFNIPHKLTYNEQDNILCVADRENGRIQCFNFIPPWNQRDPNIDHNVDDTGVMLNGAITVRQTITNDDFNGKLFAIDYSPIRGGILVAVSGLGDKGQPTMGFVYNMTTLQLLSRFSPPAGQNFGMAHDLAISNDLGEFIYVAEEDPVNLWKFSRIIPSQSRSSSDKDNSFMESKSVKGRDTKAHDYSRLSSTTSQDIYHNPFGHLYIILLISILVSAIILFIRQHRNKSSNKRHSGGLYGGQPQSINSLFGGRRFENGRQYRINANQFTANGHINRLRQVSTMFSRIGFFNIFGKRRMDNNDFSRIPFDDSDRSDGENSGSDVEEFNINKATAPENININV